MKPTAKMFQNSLTLDALGNREAERYEKIFGGELRSKRAENNLVVESTRVSIDNLNSKFLKPDANTRINESSEFLKNRNKGLSILESNYEFQQYNEQFLRDLNEIETINDRVGRDVDRRIQ